MPNRIIKESIRTSDTVAEMTDFQFRLWVGLIVSADDYGRGDARPEILKGQIFPLRKKVKEKDIESALNGLAALGCVELYSVNGKPYYSFPTWGAHQRIRNSVQKFPSPDEKDALRQVAASCGESRLESNPIQSQKESESESNPNTEDAYSVDFELFWKEYPRKIDKQKAYRSWKKISVNEYLDIAKGLEKWNAYWKERNEPEYIPHPTVWLNNRRWEYEPPKITKKRNAALNYQQKELNKQDFDRMVINLDEQ